MPEKTAERSLGESIDVLIPDYRNNLSSVYNWQHITVHCRKRDCNSESNEGVDALKKKSDEITARATKEQSEKKEERGKLDHDSALVAVSNNRTTTIRPTYYNIVELFLFAGTTANRQSSRSIAQAYTKNEETEKRTQDKPQTHNRA
jgi:hypothetical protein